MTMYEVECGLALGKRPMSCLVALDEKGRLFVPAFLAASELTVFMCASYDGTPAVSDGKHGYYPADWMKREFPSATGRIERIESFMKEQKS